LNSTVSLNTVPLFSPPPLWSLEKLEKTLSIHRHTKRALVAIMSAIFYVASLHHPPHRLLVFSDSLDSVCVLNTCTLSASEALHNAPLCGISEIVLTTGIDLHVRHISGVDNVWADLLSQLLVDDYQRLFPSHRICTFAPPRELLPAGWRECF